MDFYGGFFKEKVYSPNIATFFNKAYCLFCFVAIEGRRFEKSLMHKLTLHLSTTTVELPACDGLETLWNDRVRS